MEDRGLEVVDLILVDVEAEVRRTVDIPKIRQKIARRIHL
jgi:hypothetical protein